MVHRESQPSLLFEIHGRAHRRPPLRQSKWWATATGSYSGTLYPWRQSRSGTGPQLISESAQYYLFGIESAHSPRVAPPVGTRASVRSTKYNGQLPAPWPVPDSSHRAPGSGKLSPLDYIKWITDTNMTVRYRIPQDCTCLRNQGWPSNLNAEAIRAASGKGRWAITLSPPGRPSRDSTTNEIPAAEFPDRTPAQTLPIRCVSPPALAPGPSGQRHWHIERENTVGLVSRWISVPT
jgi:hypothetical protein